MRHVVRLKRIMSCTVKDFEPAHASQADLGLNRLLLVSSLQVKSRLNDDLRHFDIISHITAAGHIIHVFLGFHEYQATVVKCLPQGHSHEKPSGCSKARTWHLRITSPKLYH